MSAVEMNTIEFHTFPFSELHSHRVSQNGFTEEAKQRAAETARFAVLDRLSKEVNKNILQVGTEAVGHGLHDAKEMVTDAKDKIVHTYEASTGAVGQGLHDAKEKIIETKDKIVHTYEASADYVTHTAQDAKHKLQAGAEAVGHGLQDAKNKIVETYEAGADMAGETAELFVDKLDEAYQGTKAAVISNLQAVRDITLDQCLLPMHIEDDRNLETTVQPQTQLKEKETVEAGNQTEAKDKLQAGNENKQQQQEGLKSNKENKEDKEKIQTEKKATTHTNAAGASTSSMAHQDSQQASHMSSANTGLQSTAPAAGVMPPAGMQGQHGMSGQSQHDAAHTGSHAAATGNAPSRSGKGTYNRGLGTSSRGAVRGGRGKGNQFQTHGPRHHAPYQPPLYAPETLQDTNDKTHEMGQDKKELDDAKTNGPMHQFDPAAPEEGAAGEIEEGYFHEPLSPQTIVTGGFLGNGEMLACLVHDDIIQLDNKGETLLIETIKNPAGFINKEFDCADLCFRQRRWADDVHILDRYGREELLSCHRSECGYTIQGDQSTVVAWNIHGKLHWDPKIEQMIGPADSLRMFAMGCCLNRMMGISLMPRISV